MTLRKALVQITGSVQEMPAGDTIAGAVSVTTILPRTISSPTTVSLGGVFLGAISLQIDSDITLDGDLMVL